MTEEDYLSPSTLLLPDVCKGTFVSDLHLFSPRCVSQHVAQDLARISSPDHCIVLGGDIFDFRWSAHGSHTKTMAAARDWLESLVLKTAPNSHVVFLPGNHDCHPDFMEILAEFAAKEDHFHWRPHHVQIGPNLFLHGDILEPGGVAGLQQYRQRFHHSQPQSQIAHRSYDVAVGLRVHKFVPKLRHIPLRTCNRLITTLPDLPLHHRNSIQHVYFGHTHVPVNGVSLQGIQFFNPGAGLRHMRLQPRTFDISRNLVQ